MKLPIATGLLLFLGGTALLSAAVTEAQRATIGSVPGLLSRRVATAD